MQRCLGDKNSWSALAFVALLLSGCATASPSSDLLQLSHLDETFVDRVGLETENIYDPITLLQQGEAYRVKGEYAVAVETYKRFVALYPSHRMAPFAEYALGQSYMDQVQTSDRDPTPIEQAHAAFNNILTRYPETPYASGAAQHLETLRTWRAEYQLGIGLYYYKQKMYKAAISRFEEGLAVGGLAVSNAGKVTEKTLYYRGRSYIKTGNPDKAEESFRDLRARYPDSHYLKRVP